MKPQTNTHRRGRKLSTCLKLSCCRWRGRGGAALLLVGHPSTTPALRFPWRFLTRGALPMQTPCTQHGLGRHGAENRGFPTTSGGILRVSGKQNSTSKDSSHGVFCSAARRWGPSHNISSHPASFCAICNRTKSLAEDFCCQTPLLQALLLGIH